MEFTARMTIFCKDEGGNTREFVYTIEQTLAAALLHQYAAYAACAECDGVFTSENPQVCINTCAKCFTQQNDQLSLTYQGEFIIDRAMNKAHLFLSARNNRLYSVNFSGLKTPYVMHKETLLHHGFKVPDQWGHIYEVIGDLDGEAVVCKHNNGITLLYKSGKTLELFPRPEEEIAELTKKARREKPHTWHAKLCQLINEQARPPQFEFEEGTF